MVYRRKMIDNTKLQLLLPEKLRLDVFNVLLGHQGRDRTISLFKEGCDWPGMDRFFADHVKRCERCIQRKAVADVAEFQPITSSTPMDVVCIYFLSIGRSKGGKHPCIDRPL